MTVLAHTDADMDVMLRQLRRDPYVFALFVAGATRDAATHAEDAARLYASRTEHGDTTADFWGQPPYQPPHHYHLCGPHRRLTPET